MGGRVGFTLRVNAVKPGSSRTSWTEARLTDLVVSGNSGAFASENGPNLASRMRLQSTLEPSMIDASVRPDSASFWRG